MATEKMNLDQLLCTLGLKAYYPEQLSRDHLYQLTNKTLKRDKKEDTPLVWQFIQDIVLYNYNARNIENKVTQTKNISMSGFRQRHVHQKSDITSCIHPLDIIVSVFLCCEPTARQDLVMHMWTCRLAVPFILRLYENLPASVYLWPLRSIIGQVVEKNEFFERQLIKESMDCMGFVRVGENNTWSKSYLLDCLIWGPDKTHSTFIHRDSEGSKSTRSFCVDGLVEIAWYLPNEETEERFSGPKVLLNLRGDSREHHSQTKIIGEIASVTIVLTTVNDLSSSVPVIKDLIAHDSRVIILLSDRRTDLDKVSKIVEEFFFDIPIDELEILELEQKRLPEVLKFIHFNIKQMQQGSRKKISLSDFVKNMSSMTAFVDETDTDYKDAFESAKDILHEIITLDEESRKATLFPLQENYWKQWAQTERDYNRFHQLDDKKRETLNVESQEQLQVQMARIRADQYKYIDKNGISKPIDLFIQALFSFDNCHSKRNIFMRFLKLELDDISRRQLVPLNRNYQKLINKSAGAKEFEKVMINRKLGELDAVKSSLSFGLENIFREVGQIYEACEYQSRKTELRLSDKQMSVQQYKRLPKCLCHCLKDGYPFELVDGEARSIPPFWTKAVLSELESVLREDSTTSKKPTLHVISVLGIQSSGKSTLINVMFGLQFQVGAGRCTRGAFMLLVKVHESLSAALNEDVDYIAVIDTEGLRTAALSSVESLKHDNESSTFVIGLAHTTLINLMGENATYLQENLPIVVQAFLRMYLVHLHPRCTIVHHNVDKRNREKMLQQGLILQSVLDQLTKRACETEKVPQKSFQDIIAFDVVEHTRYIPSLLEGVMPMAPISVGYSSEADSARIKLIEFLKPDDTHGGSCKYSVKSFSDHLFNLWNAILKDNFLYEFRTTTEVALRLEVDRKYLDILLSLIEDISTIVSKMTRQIQSGQINSDSAIRKLDAYLNKQVTKHQNTFKSFFDGQKKTTPYLPDQWRSNYIESFQERYRKLLEDARIQIREFEHRMNRQSRMSPKEIEDFLQRCDEVSFDQAWVEFKPKSSTRSNQDFLSDAVEALKDVCFSGRHLLRFDENCRLADFRILEDKHINHPFVKFSDLEIARLKDLMNDVITTVKSEYDSEKFNFVNRNPSLSYSSRIPKKILLRVEKNLSARLQSEDPLHGISNQFKIDLLSCVAMSCVHEMKRIFERDHDAVAEYLKGHLRTLMFSKIKLENNLSMAIFGLIDQSIKHNFNDQILFLMLDGMQRSVYKQSITSKRLLIGSCMKFFISENRDDIMIEYIQYPKSALKSYLKLLVDKYISEVFLEYDFQFYIRRAIDNVWKEFEEVWRDFEISEGEQEESLSQSKVIKTIISRIDIPSIIKDMAYERFKRLVKGSNTVNFKTLKDMMLHYVESFIREKVTELQQPILEKKNEFISILADTLTERLIGCLHRCPLCREICLLSEGHSSSHIFLHRLKYTDSDFHHRTEDICSIWKWISYQKRDILSTRKLQMFETVPDEWKFISKKEVLSNIEDLFGLK